MNDYDVIILEGGWSWSPDPDQARVPPDLAKAFVARGGQLIVCDVDRNSNHDKLDALLSVSAFRVAPARTVVSPDAHARTMTAGLASERGGEDGSYLRLAAQGGQRAGEAKSCGKPAVEQFKGTLDSPGSTPEVGLSGDLCRDRIEALKTRLAAMGMRVHTIVDSKPRAAHVAHSGAIFSTAEARKWLHAQGLLATSNGRVSRELLDLYAASH